MTATFARFGGMGFAEPREVDPREFRTFAAQFGELVRSLPLQLPENFVLVIRSMTLTSGVASALDPAFNSWNSVEPYAATVLRVERGNIVQDLAREALDVASIAERTPGDWTHSSRTSKTAGCRSTGRDKSGRWLGATAPLFGALLIAGAVLRTEDTVFGTVPSHPGPASPAVSLCPIGRAHHTR